eukprot:TRINITY_DN15159_c0_g1_i3.p1 TRINITY_DN15159_c0_g1~~TRINITY_DN15159_c0_g1_i3.p1  ORF type:complete len:396 (-),score=76.45 TRINITY_DN15159_c0_g1_i3:42-1229(-)
MMEISTKEKDLKEVSAKHIKGYVYLAVTIVLYLIGPFLIKETYINAKTRYKKPFFIGYFCSGCFLVYIFPLLFRRIYRRCSKEVPEPNTKLLSDSRIFYVATVLGILGVAQCYLYNLAVEYTSVSSNMILHDTSDVFVYIFCIMLLGWKFSWTRFFAVFISVIGVFLIGYSDSYDSQQASSLKGDLISLSSTVFYGLLLTMTKVYIVDEDVMDWPKFFLYTGLSTLVIWIPVLWILHVTRLETFELPNRPTLYMLLLTGLLNYVIADYTFNLATVLLDPLLVDLGLGAISPLAMVIEHYYSNKQFDAIYLVGYGLIMVAFVILVIYDVCYEVKEQAESLEPTKPIEGGDEEEVEALKAGDDTDTVDCVLFNASLYLSNIYPVSYTHLTLPTICSV